MSDITTTQIGTIGNYYGGLHVFRRDGKFYWFIENWDTVMRDPEEAEEIPESLYNELIKMKR